jgi:hypothetical protein
MRQVFLVTVLSTLFLLAAGEVQAADRFVSTTGSDAGNTCSVAGTPCRTISHALAEAASGDVIKIATGTYAENLSISTAGTRTLEGGWNAAFTVQDIAGTPTILQGATDRALKITAGTGVSNTTTLDGLTIANSVPGTLDGDGELSGGGLLAESSDTGVLTLNLTDVTMTKNKAPEDGGALRVRSSGGSTMEVNITDSTFTKNSAGESAGAIEADALDTSDLTLHIPDTSCTGNKAKDSSGAIDTDSFDNSTLTLTATRVTFFKNKAGIDGGAMEAEASGDSEQILKFINSVFVRNSAKDDGGALSIESFDTASMTFSSPNSTFTENKAKDDGGGIRFFSADSSTMTATIKNDIVWGNTAGNGDDVQLSETDSSSLTLTRSFSNIADLVNSSATLVDGGGNVNVDPLLVKPAAGDVHLEAGSPMIDAGTCTGAPADDFEGDPRPSGAGCDIGADEFV